MFAELFIPLSKQIDRNIAALVFISRISVTCRKMEVSSKNGLAWSVNSNSRLTREAVKPLQTASKNSLNRILTDAPAAVT